MLAGVRRRAERAGMSDRIQLHLAAPEKIGVSGPVDFALAFWMVHEVRYQEAFLTGIFDVLKTRRLPDGIPSRACMSAPASLTKCF